MIRSTNKLNIRKRHKKIINLSKGYKGSLSRLFISSKQATLKALKYSYDSRKSKKQEYPKLWVKRINIACNLNNFTYKTLKKNIREKSIALNKKILAKICISDIKVIEKLIKI